MFASGSTVVGDLGMANGCAPASLIHLLVSMTGNSYMPSDGVLAWLSSLLGALANTNRLVVFAVDIPLTSLVGMLSCAMRVVGPPP